MQLDSERVWNDCLQLIRGDIATQSYITWFEPIKPVKYANDVLTIEVPSQFFYEYLEEHYVHVLKKAINNVLGPEAKLEYSVIVDTGSQNSSPYTINLPNQGTPKRNRPVNGNGKETGPGYKSPFVMESVDSFYQESQLNPNYLFSTFIEGDCNRLARSAGFAVAKKAGNYLI